MNFVKTPEGQKRKACFGQLDACSVDDVIIICLLYTSIERGDVIAEDGKKLRDYITEYQFRAKDDQIHRFATIFGLDEDKLRNMTVSYTHLCRKESWRVLHPARGISDDV